MNFLVFLNRRNPLKQLFLILTLIFPVLLTPLKAEEQLNSYLLTVGPGSELYLWFGHTGIIIEENNRSRFYDFGNFSFETEHFYRNFAMGRLIYQKIGVSAPAYLNYIVRENRDVTLQKLNIPQDKIREMQLDLEFNTLPGNNTYLYHHYLDNCSTRPRDIIDRALDGQLKKATNRPAGTSFRRSFRRYSGHSFFADWLLSLLQGRTIDEPITEWDTMFLPDELSAHLDRLMVDSDKGPVPAVTEKKVLARAVPGRMIPDEPPASAGWSLFYGLIAGLALLALQEVRIRQTGIRGTVSALLFMLLMISLSIFGSLFYFISFFTDHLVARENINIMVIHPLYLIPAVFLFRKTLRGLKGFWIVQAGLWVLMVLINVLFFHQGNLQTTLFFLPLLACQLGAGNLKMLPYRKPVIL